jgi:hypothetical protein
LSDREKTDRKIGEKYSLNHITVKKYYKRYQEILNEKQEVDNEPEINT